MRQNLDMNTPQTSGMTRAAAITHARTGAEKLWAGTMVETRRLRAGIADLATVLRRSVAFSSCSSR
jgi:uncharacterized RmlC-like cupin family protein